MKNQKKWIAMAALMTLLTAAVLGCALADEKIYTSPTFKLPADKIVQWVESLPDETSPAEGEEAAAPAEGEEAVTEEGEATEAPVPAEGEETAAPAEGEPPAEGETPAEDETPAEGETPVEGETPAEGEAPAEGEIPAEPTEEPKPERKVTITSTQGDVVTEGEIIYLESKLEGFDDVQVTYQWQVDKGDGQGWVNVEGANRERHMFIASKETIRYSWRLLVDIVE